MLNNSNNDIDLIITRFYVAISRGYFSSIIFNIFTVMMLKILIVLPYKKGISLLKLINTRFDNSYFEVPNYFQVYANYMDELPKFKGISFKLLISLIVIITLILLFENCIYIYQIPLAIIVLVILTTLPTTYVNIIDNLFKFKPIVNYVILGTSLGLLSSIISRRSFKLLYKNTFPLSISIITVLVFIVQKYI